MEEVGFVYEVSGEWKLLLKIVASSTRHFNKIIDLIRSRGNILETKV